MAKRKCGAKTKAGKACRAKGIRANGFCMAHQPKDEKERLGFGGAQPNAGRPKMPSVSEIQRQLVEQNAAIILRPHFRALGYDFNVDPATGDFIIDESGRISMVMIEDGGIRLHTTFEGDVVVSNHEDLGAQIEAAEKLLNRALGRPKQQTELSGEVTINAPDLSNLTDKELEQWEALQRKAAAS